MTSKTILSVVTVATAVCALASLKSDAFAPAHQLSFFPRRTKKLCAGDDDKGEEPKKPIDREQDDSRSGSNGELRYLQDDLTRAREAETRPADSDFSGATSAFDRPITVKNSYGDDVVGMVKHLPALFDQSKQLENTELGQKYASLRLPIFILGSNKLEGTLSPHASEGDTFDFLLKYVENGTDAVHLIPSGEDEDEQQITWEADGNSNTTEAWYEQCMCHLRALVMMLDWAKAGEPLTTEKMLACHSVLMKGAVTSTGTAFQSRFRHDDESVYAAQYVFPVRIDHEENMANLLDQMNSKFGTVHPVEWSCDLLLKVLSAHPFLKREWPHG